MKSGLHIGIILDGNRRYAWKKGLKVIGSHALGADKVWDLFDWCDELGVGELTLYTFSLENFHRPKNEVSALFNLFRKNLERLQKDSRKSKSKFRFIGRLDMFPKDIYSDMIKLMEESAGNRGSTINFAMGYGGRAEIVDAIKKISTQVRDGKLKVEDISEDIVSENLYMKDEPDLILRPGGEHRVSNFLIWQSHYSEWVFLDKLWPELTKRDVANAIKEFHSRKRRYGK